MVTVKKHNRWTMPLVAAVVLFATILQLVTPLTTYAKTADDIRDINDKYYAARYLRDCLATLDSRLKNNISVNAVTNNTWLYGGDRKVVIGRHFEPTDGVAGCEETDLVKKAMMSLGYGNDPGKLLTDIGYTRQGDNFVRPASGDTMNTTIVNKLQQPNFARYVYYQQLFVNNCKLVEPTKGKGETITIKKVVKDNSGNYTTQDVQMQWLESGVHGSISNHDFDEGKPTSVSCDNLRKSLDTVLVNDVVRYNNAHKDDPIVDAAANDTNNDNKPIAPDQQCSGGSLGWIFCGIVTGATNAMVAMAEFIDDFMHFSPLLGSTEGEAIQAAWRVVVGPANLLLAIAFLVVIFSQATSIGLNAYGIKKMLPRIIAAAILINLSFFVCAILVDIFNIIGTSIGTVFLEAMKLIPPSPANPNMATWSDSLIGAALFITAGVFVVNPAIVFSLVPIIVSMLAAVFVFLMILALRHIFVLLLIIISPLAIAAMVLPNTEQLTKRWAKFFGVSLALYPIVIGLSHVSILAAKIVFSTITGTSLRDFFSAAMGAFLIVAWVFGAKGLATMGGGIMAKIGAITNNPTKGFIDRSRNFAKKRQDRSAYATARATRDQFRDQDAKIKAFDKMERGDWRTRGAFMGKKARGRMSSFVYGQNQKIYDQDVADEQTRLGRGKEGNNLTEADAHLRSTLQNKNSTEAQVHAAVNNMLAHKGGKTSLRDIYKDSTVMGGASDAAWTGMTRAALGNQKFADAHQDIANALSMHNSGFQAATKTTGGTSAFLGANFVNGKTLGTGPGTGPKVPGSATVEVANGVKDWGWIAQRGGQVLAASDAHTGHLYDKISFDSAQRIQKSEGFIESDPGIQEMINSIVAAGAPPVGSGAANNLPTYAPGGAAPSWVKFST